MKLLLVSATQLEVHEYLMSAPHHDVLISGVGLAAATFEITNQLNHHHYDLVIQAGVAGAFEQSGLQPGDIVTVKKDAFGDCGVYENEKIVSLQEAGLSSEKEWLVNSNDKALRLLDVPQVKAITVNTLSDNINYISALQKRWQPDVESMEGAALHFVCQKKHIPFLQVRSISNMVGQRNKAEWRLGTAVANLNQVLFALCSRLVPVLS